MKKIGRVVSALLIGLTLSVGGFISLGSVNTVEAKSNLTSGIEMEYGSDWKEGRVGYWGGCGLSEALGLFKCHPSEVPWGDE